MKISELRLPEHIELCTFTSAQALTQHLSTRLCQYLEHAIEQESKASLAVSGGSTPVPLFQALSRATLDWHNVDITLVDERWVPHSDPASNTQLVKENLLQEHAANARFVELWQADTSAYNALVECHQRLTSLHSPLTAAVLGMGNDGHTASLFPCAHELTNALTSKQYCAALTPTSAPHTRITLTPHYLLNSTVRILHIVGQDKLDTLAKALAVNDVYQMPICLFLQHPLIIYWAP